MGAAFLEGSRALRASPCRNLGRRASSMSKTQHFYTSPLRFAPHLTFQTPMLKEGSKEEINMRLLSKLKERRSKQKNWQIEGQCCLFSDHCDVSRWASARRVQFTTPLSSANGFECDLFSRWRRRPFRTVGSGVPVVAGTRTRPGQRLPDALGRIPTRYEPLDSTVG